MEVGKDISYQELRDENDAVIIAIGSTNWRDLPIPGRELEGIHQAMEFLVPSNKVQEGDFEQHPFSAYGKNVIIIVGGILELIVSELLFDMVLRQLNSLRLCQDRQIIEITLLLGQLGLL